jgi:hypothetical protein
MRFANTSHGGIHGEEGKEGCEEEGQEEEVAWRWGPSRRWGPFRFMYVRT